MKDKINLKKILLLLFSIFVFISYFLATDPDAKLIQNLPFGTQLVLLMPIFIIAALAIAFIETYTDIYTDDIAKDESEIARMARGTPEGAGYILIAKSIRILAYAIITAALVFSVNGLL